MSFAKLPKIVLCLKYFPNNYCEKSSSYAFTATVVKSDPGSLPEGKVKIRLEHDGTLLDVDEDDIEKVGVMGYLALVSMVVLFLSIF